MIPAPNLRLELSDGEYKDRAHNLSKGKVGISNLDHDTYVEIIEPANDLRQDKKMMVIAPEDMVRKSFLSKPTHNGTIDSRERHRAFIIKEIEEHDNKIAKDPARIKFLCSFNNDQYQEILAYNDIIRHIEKDHDDLDVWKFKRITSHEGPILPHQHNYKGSSYNVMIEWETGEITTEPLGIISADDPVTCAIYAKQQYLLDTPG